MVLRRPDSYSDYFEDFEIFDNKELSKTSTPNTVTEPHTESDTIDNSNIIDDNNSVEEIPVSQNSKRSRDEDGDGEDDSEDGKRQRIRSLALGSLSADVPQRPFAEIIIGGHRVQALLDSGASRSFISPGLVKKLNLPRIQCTPSMAQAANGDEHQVDTMVRVPLEWANYKANIDCFVYPLGGLQLVFGFDVWTDFGIQPGYYGKKWSGIFGGERSVFDTCLPDPEYLMSPSQLQRELHKGEAKECFIVSVRPAGGNNQEKSVEWQGLRTIVDRYSDVFSQGGYTIREKGGVEHTIPTDDAQPVAKQPYRVGETQLRAVREQLDDLLKRGLIRPSSSAWAAPVIIVGKKDGGFRMCCDYRALNTVTAEDRYPIPHTQDCIDRLGGARYFSRIDLASGYHQVRMAEEDIPKTAFTTRYGSFEWLVMPFGLKGAPATFQRYMNSVMQPFLDKFVIQYLDDTLIFSKTKDEHEEHVIAVLERLRQEGLLLKPSKCAFGLRKTEFLGHIVGEGNVEPANDKVDAVRNWPVPKTVTQLRSLLGLTNYYRQFVPGYAATCQPLYKLTGGKGGNRGLVWDDKARAALEELKNKLADTVALRAVDWDKEFFIESDASAFAIGAVLSQEHGDKLVPIAFESKTLSAAERNYSAREREMFGVVYALKKWKHYVRGNKVTVITDHKGLERVFIDNEPSGRVARWLEDVQEYAPTIVYRAGKDHIPADALSRRFDLAPLDKRGSEVVEGKVPRSTPDGGNSVEVSKLDPDWPLQFLSMTQELANGGEKDKEWTVAYDRWKKQFSAVDGELYRRIGDIQVPYVRAIGREKLVEQYHRQLAHMGVGTMMSIIKHRHWWPGQEATVRKVLARCPECQACGKGEELKVPITPLEPVKGPFKRWGIDFIGRLPTSTNGNRWILLAIDHMTNWIEAAAVPVADVKTVADFIHNNIVMRFGCPEVILSDRGTQFRSSLVAEYCKRQGIKQTFTSAYHPQSNGKTERANGTIGSAITKYAFNRKSHWDEYLETAVWATRVRKHSTTKQSPFYLVYGTEPRLVTDIQPPAIPWDLNKPEDCYDNRLKDFATLSGNRLQAVENQLAAAFKVSEQHRQLGEVKRFTTDEWVMIKNMTKTKFDNAFMGPFRVVKQAPFYTYKLALPSGEEIPELFHNDRLRRCTIGELAPKKLWTKISVNLKQKIKETYEEGNTGLGDKEGMM